MLSLWALLAAPEKSLVFLHGSIIASSAGVQGQIEAVMRSTEVTLNTIVADAKTEFQKTQGTVDIVYNRHEYRIKQSQATIVEAKASFEQLLESDREFRSKLNQSFTDLDKVVTARFASVDENFSNLATEETRQSNAP